MDALSDPLALASHLEDAHDYDAARDLDTSDLRSLHRYLHNGKAVIERPDHEHEKAS